MKRIMLIGQAPPKVIVDLPFGKSILYKWLESVGITYKKKADFELRHNQEGEFILKNKPVALVKFGALINFFPGTNKSGGHLAPTKEQINNEKLIMKRLITEFQPEVIIPIGKLSIEECLGLHNSKLDNIIGNEFLADPYQVLGKKIRIIPLPHPSGASTWHFKEANKILLKKALDRLKYELEH